MLKRHAKDRQTGQLEEQARWGSPRPRLNRGQYPLCTPPGLEAVNGQGGVTTLKPGRADTPKLTHITLDPKPVLLHQTSPTKAQIIPAVEQVVAPLPSVTTSHRASQMRLSKVRRRRFQRLASRCAGAQAEASSA